LQDLLKDQSRCHVSHVGGVTNCPFTHRIGERRSSQVGSSVQAGGSCASTCERMQNTI
jgi:hypothetical protein